MAQRVRTADADLYAAIVDRVRRGEPYELAAPAEQRARGFPVRPFLAVRPPALATLLAISPSDTFSSLVEAVLAAAVVFAWMRRLRPPTGRAIGLAWTAFFVFTGVGVSLMGNLLNFLQGVAPGLGAHAANARMILLHETWAGQLIALSLALRTDTHFWAAAAVGLAAALIRELALPYLLVMALFAAIERRPREAASFVAALLAASLALAWHAHALAPHLRPDDPASPGWLVFGGWRFVMMTASWNAMTPFAPALMTAVIIPASLAGAISWKDPDGARLFVLLAGFALGFTVVGRDQNFYWGLVTAPLVGVGLALAPAALGDLWRRALDRRAIAAAS